MLNENTRYEIDVTGFIMVKPRRKDGATYWTDLKGNTTAKECKTCNTVKGKDGYHKHKESLAGKCRKCRNEEYLNNMDVFKKRSEMYRKKNFKKIEKYRKDNAGNWEKYYQRDKIQIPDVLKINGFNSNSITYGRPKIKVLTDYTGDLSTVHDIMCLGCGNVWEQDLTGFIACVEGCHDAKTDNQSRGEAFIEKILQGLGLFVRREYRYKDLRSGTNSNNDYLRYDFAIINKSNKYKASALIEYDGEYHDTVVKSRGGLEALRLRQEYDALKDEYARNHGIPLLRIPYTTPIEDIAQKVNTFLIESGAI